MGGEEIIEGHEADDMVFFVDERKLMDGPMAHTREQVTMRLRLLGYDWSAVHEWSDRGIERSAPKDVLADVAIRHDPEEMALAIDDKDNLHRATVKSRKCGQDHVLRPDQGGPPVLHRMGARAGIPIRRSPSATSSIPHHRSSRADPA